MPHNNQTKDSSPEEIARRRYIARRQYMAKRWYVAIGGAVVTVFCMLGTILAIGEIEGNYDIAFFIALLVMIVGRIVTATIMDSMRPEPSEDND